MTEKEKKEQEVEEVVEPTEEVVDDTPVDEPPAEPADVPESEDGDKTPKEDEEKKPAEEEKPQDEPVEEKPDEEVPPEEPPVEEPTEETEPPVEEEVTEDVNNETEQKEDELEKLRKEVEELRTEKENQEEVKGFAKDVEVIKNKFDDICDKLAGALQEEFKKYDIDTTKTIDEIAKEDPTKATIAKNLVEQAEHIRAEQEANARKAIENKYTDIIFNKADRILSKLDISDDEAPIVAQTFVDIVQRVGITDLEGDLTEKIRLSVANAKYIVGQRAGEVLQPVEEIEAAAADIVDDAVQEVAKEDVEEEVVTEVPEQEQQEEVVEEVKPDLEELKQGADANGTGVNAGLTEDTVLDYLASLPTKERVKFYKENLALITRASKKAYNRGN